MINNDPKDCTWCNECRALVEMESGYGHKVQCNEGLKARRALEARALQGFDEWLARYGQAYGAALEGDTPDMLRRCWIDSRAGNLLKMLLSVKPELDLDGLTAEASLERKDVFFNVQPVGDLIEGDFTEHDFKAHLHADAGITGEWLQMFSDPENRKTAAARLCLETLPDGVDPFDERVEMMLDLIAMANLKKD